MKTRADQSKKENIQLLTKDNGQESKRPLPVADQRPETVQLQKMQGVMANSAQVKQLAKTQKRINEQLGGQATPIQRAANKTGLPNHLKTGIEHLSGYAMDDVKVHYNSSKPAQLNAHAYAQGTQIHLASGQEKHLPHEAWHVVQQKQGRVSPTVQLKGESLNDDHRLEKEADSMGTKAVQMKAKTSAGQTSRKAVIQQKPVLQLEKNKGGKGKKPVKTEAQRKATRIANEKAKQANISKDMAKKQAERAPEQQKMADDANRQREISDKEIELINAAVNRYHSIAQTAVSKVIKLRNDRKANGATQAQINNINAGHNPSKTIDPKNPAMIRGGTSADSVIKVSPEKGKTTSGADVTASKAAILQALHVISSDSGQFKLTFPDGNNKNILIHFS
ncbi:MAG: DUF4157 domain-containing protein [Bacteroidota bacterium]